MIASKYVRFVLAATLLGSMLVVLGITCDFSTSDASTKAQQEERHLESLIPKHIPLGLKIRKEKEKEFKDLGNERWAHDFELEVTNTGDRPIYEFFLYLILDVKDSSGQNVMAPVYYGRAELGDHRVRATPEDVPLKPGQSCILKIHPGQLEAWDIIRREEGRPYPKKISVKFQLLSFGDGTGLVGPDGRAVPRRSGTPPNLTECLPNQSRGEPAFDWHLSILNNRREQARGLNIPASFLPVNFLSAASFSTFSPRPAPVSDICCPAGCTSLIPRVEQACYNCPQQTRLTITYCSDPEGLCYSPSYGSIECTIPQTGESICAKQSRQISVADHYLPRYRRHRRRLSVVPRTVLIQMRLDLQTTVPMDFRLTVVLHSRCEKGTAVFAASALRRHLLLRSVRVDI